MKPYPNTEISLSLHQIKQLCDSTMKFIEDAREKKRDRQIKDALEYLNKKTFWRKLTRANTNWTYKEVRAELERRRFVSVEIGHGETNYYRIRYLHENTEIVINRMLKFIDSLPKNCYYPYLDVDADTLIHLNLGKRNGYE